MLRFGYADGKYYSNEEISKMLEIDESDAMETIQKIYEKDDIKFIDWSIEVITKKPFAREKTIKKNF